MQGAAAFSYHFLQFPDSSFKEQPIRRVEFKPIKSKQPGFKNLSSIGSCTVEAAMLFSDIDSGLYRNGCHYLAFVSGRQPYRREGRRCLSYYGGAMSNILLRTEVPLVEQGTCKNDYEYLIDVNDRMLCAGTDRHDACQGDSGGPLSLHGEVVAVVSIGTYCALKEYPTIYMKVSKFHSWIKNTIDRHL
ncbi:Trypsin zeta [Eumeta japonica]|uniref:Trypsin zeta n=1 Tax=Eumeta variegata TaxID=151549 RepID=A0A4C1ZNI6_EUMVA|nr:Trypsin zeta [Eumeta japonica]